MRDDILDPREEQLLTDALDALDGGLAPDPGDREAVELWAVLASALEPATPPPGARDRLLDRLAAAEAGPAPFPLHRRPETPAPPRWPFLALAASTLVALGLGVLAVAGSRENQRLQDRLALLERRLESEQASLRAAEVELAGAHGRLGLVTNISTEICPLRPASDSVPADARGVLWIAADHQHWHLAVEGLHTEEGSELELWFLVGEDKVPVSGGRFRMTAGERIELGSPEMPEGTRAVAITLEPIDDSPEPQGPMVLYGDDVRTMI